ncbi:MAG: long-chain fatty acid--CoA ligase [Burkholderiales bacterium]
MTHRHFAHWPKALPRSLEAPHTALHYNLEVSAHRYPDRPMTIFYDTPLTYARAWAEARALAGFLQQHCRVKRGDRVLMYLQNCPQFILAFYGILRADAMVVPVNPMNLAEELRHYATNADATTILCGQERFEQVRPLLDDGTVTHAIVVAYSDYATAATDLPLPEAVSAPRLPIAGAGITLWSDAVGAGCVPAPGEAGPEDLCVMPYTSGTTGLPKGCIHTHGTAMMTAVAGAAWMRHIPDSVSLSTLPNFHVTGMQSSMNGPIFLGGTIVMMQRWDRDTAARLIERYSVNTWTNIATMAIDFLSNPSLADYRLTSLVRIGGGGAAMPEAVAQRLHDMLGLDYIEGYGLSETIAPTHINPPDRPKKQCLGIPIFDTEARVIDPTTFAVLGPNEVGEIVVSGPQVFKGYWKSEAATAAAFLELEGRRFFRTGDLGRYDDDGYFFITDRLKRMINASGFKVWPAEVEALLYRHPDIQEACVISTPDATRGETVKAVVVLRDGHEAAVTPDDIVAWSRQYMAAYKIPRVVEFARSLPRSGTGKVQWRALQEAEWR